MTRSRANDSRRLWPFYLAVFAMPILGGGNFPWLAEAHTASLVWQVLVLLVWTSTTVQRPVGFRDLFAHRPLWPFYLFSLWLVALVPFSQVIDASVKTSLVWVGAMLLAQTALQLRLDEKERTRTLIVYFAAVVFCAVYGIYQGLWGMPALKSLEGLSADDLKLLAEVQRPFSFFPGANVFGGVLVSLMPIAVLLFLAGGRLRTRVALGAGVALVVTALLFSYSRGAWAVCLVGLFPVALAAAGHRKRRRVILAFAALFALAYVFFLGLQFEADPSRDQLAQSVIDRFYALGHKSDASVKARLGYWATGLAMGHAHFPFGAGPGTFAELSRLHQTLPNYTRSPHNVLIQLYAETGPIGLMLFFWLLVSAAREAWRRRDGDASPWALRLIAVAALLALLHGLIDIDFESPAVIGAFFLFTALLWTPALPQAIRKGRASDPTVRTLAATAFIVLFFVGRFLPFLGGRYYDLSLAAEETGAREKARAFTADSLAVWPYNPAAHYRQSRFLIDDYQGSKDSAALARARAEVERAIALSPGNPEYRLGLADVIAMAGDRQAALDALRAAAQLYPTSVYYRYELARGLALAGNLSHAVYELNDVLRYEQAYLDHKNPNGIDLIYARFLRAAILNDQKQYGEAIDEYGRIIRLCQDSGLILNAYTSQRPSHTTCEQIVQQAKDYIGRVETDRKASDSRGQPQPAPPMNIPLQAPALPDSAPGETGQVPPPAHSDDGDAH